MYEDVDIGHDLKMAFEDGYQAGVEAAQPMWISVEERLPDNNGNFITKIHCEKGDWIEFDTFDHAEKGLKLAIDLEIAMNALHHSV